MRIRYALTTAALAAACFNGSAQGAVVAGPVIGGLATFTDTTTGHHWLKLNDFFETSGTAMIAAATAAGFQVATRADVTGLVSTLPLDGTVVTWNSYATIMGQAPNRDLLWGAYVPDPTSNLGWAFSFSTASSWSFVDNAFPASGVANSGSPFADENLWAFTDATGVPEPAGWALLIGGFGLVATAMRRRTLALPA